MREGFVRRKSFLLLLYYSLRIQRPKPSLYVFGLSFYLFFCIAYYPLDCDSKDHSDNGRHGANIGSALYSEDAKCGNSRFFNGASKIQVDAFNGFNWGQAFSVSVWIKRTGQAGNYQGVVNNGYYSTGSWEIRMGREFGGTMIGGGVVTSNSPRTWDYQITGRVLTLDEWHHVVMAYDGADGSLKYYIDGVERDGDESCCSGALLVKNTPLTIGQAGSGSSTEYFYGFIDEVKLFAETLTADDVSKLYNTPCQ